MGSCKLLDLAYTSAATVRWPSSNLGHSWAVRPTISGIMVRRLFFTSPAESFQCSHNPANAEMMGMVTKSVTKAIEGFRFSSGPKASNFGQFSATYGWLGISGKPRNLSDGALRHRLPAQELHLDRLHRKDGKLQDRIVAMDYAEYLDPEYASTCRGI